MSVLLPLAAALRAGAGADPFRIEGRVVASGGLTLEIEGLAGLAARGDRIAIDHEGGELTAEVTDIGGARVRAVGFQALEGVRLGAAARLLGPATLAPCDAWLGRVIDPFGRPMDSRGALPPGRLRDRYVPRLHRPDFAAGSGHASTSGCARSTLSARAGRASGSACSPRRALGNRP